MEAKVKKKSNLDKLTHVSSCFPNLAAAEAALVRIAVLNGSPLVVFAFDL